MVTVANGVMFAASAGNAPNAYTGYPGAAGGFFALDAGSGNILWQFTAANDPAMGSVVCGPAIADGIVYWGSGYSHLANAFGISGTPKLYAFSLNYLSFARINGDVLLREQLPEGCNEPVDQGIQSIERHTL